MSVYMVDVDGKTIAVQPGSIIDVYKNIEGERTVHIFSDDPDAPIKCEVV